MSDRPRFALRFISGKYQGGEFPLRMNREIIIGRSSDLDMVLVEDMVSRRHAKISSSEADVFIQDKVDAVIQFNQQPSVNPVLALKYAAAHIPVITYDIAQKGFYFVGVDNLAP